MMPQFACISEDGNSILQENLEFVDLIVCCSKWGAKCERGKALLAAHYTAPYLEMLQDAETEPELAGGTEISSDRISHEKVGEVEVRFRAAANTTNSSNENNDPTSTELKSTLYGRQYLSLLRTLGGNIAVTSHCWL